MPELTITEYTDPGCPFAWSAEPARRRLEWLYGEHLRWQVRMVGLADDPSVYERIGFTTERQSDSFRRLAQAHHMPMDTGRRPRMAATLPACRAVVAVRRHAPQFERPMLRALRVEHFSGQLLDEPATLAAAAERVGLAPGDLEGWMAEPETEAALQADLQAARHPSERALALSHKLARSNGGHRYTCPSYEIEREETELGLALPGFQPLAAYEVAVANLAPDAARRADPQDVAEVLRWAGEPLATAEVAEVCQIELDQAREELGRVAREEHVGFDGLWQLDEPAALGG
jgi:predicted DsbA family dithiol-disulfide isomerase